MRILRLSVVIAGLAAQLLCAAGCASRETLWVFSSVRHRTEDELKGAFAREFPSADVKWYLAGSEKLAQTLEARRIKDDTLGDLVIAADPFWFVTGKKSGLFDSYETVRLLTYGIAYNAKVVSASDAPRTWKDLLAPRWRGKILMPSPLESGTTFAFIAAISKVYGKEYLEALKRNGTEIGTTSDSVLARLASGDRPIALLLVEDALRARRDGLPVEAIYPEDGAIEIPGQVAVLKTAKSPRLARRAYDYLFSEAAQNIFVENGMYSPLKASLTPPGAKPRDQVRRHELDWSGAWAAEVAEDREKIKESFAALFLTTR
jgi:iron(III) transport system substrate-binding protein